MSLTQYEKSMHEFIVAKEQFDSLSKACESTLEALDVNPKTKKLDGFRRTCLALGVESAPVELTYRDIALEASDNARNLIAKLGIGAMTQKLIDLIKVIFNRLLGRGGNQLAENLQSILASIKEINGVRYTKRTAGEFPRFATSQDEENWKQVWTGYKDRMAELDPRLKNVGLKEFYMSYTVPRDQEFYRLAGNAIAATIGLPPCYASGERVKSVQEYLGLLSRTRSAIATLRTLKVSDDGTDLVIDDAAAVTDFAKELETTYETKWRRKRFLGNKLPSEQAWPMSYTANDLPVLRNVDIYIRDLKQETERMVAQVRIKDMLSTAINRLPEENREANARKLTSAANKWLHMVSSVLTGITQIHTSLSITDQRLEQNLKTYRRVLDLIHRG